eukprot:5550464-Pleurochrysis_carterae.AAC.1
MTAPKRRRWAPAADDQSVSAAGACTATGCTGISVNGAPSAAGCAADSVAQACRAAQAVDLHRVASAARVAIGADAAGTQHGTLPPAVPPPAVPPPAVPPPATHASASAAAAFA